jgi:WD40 repeat protein
MSRIQKSLQSYLSDPKKEQKFHKLEPFARLQGHSGNIEDLTFKSDSNNCEIVSVGIDRYILFWDIRSDTKKPISKVHKAHTDDINTVDWCKLD